MRFNAPNTDPINGIHADVATRRSRDTRSEAVDLKKRLCCCPEEESRVAGPVLVCVCHG